MPKTAKEPADYTLPLYMNGLSGRMLRLPPPKRYKRETLFVYGHHTSLERIFGVGEFLNQFGGVTVPDLPGFGGMEPFYKIGEKPTLDNMADYLAAFIKLRYKNRKFIIVGYSLGFMIVTRMLQKHPEVAHKVDMVVSCVGIVHKDDFVFKKRTFLLFRYAASFFSSRLPAAFLRHIIFSRVVLLFGYRYIEPLFIKGPHSKIRDADKKERKRRVDFEIYLWQSNDVRTYMEMATTMFTLNLTGIHIDLPVHHIAIDNDRYFDNNLVEQHMRAIYKDFHLYKGHAPSHSASVIATKSDAAPYIPPALRRILRKKT